MSTRQDKVEKLSKLFSQGNRKMVTLFLSSIIYLCTLSLAFGGTPAPYTAEANNKIDEAGRRIGVQQLKESTTPEERMRASVELMRDAYEAAGYNYDDTIVRIADDMQNHPERIPKNEITVVNHVVAGIHVMMSECDYQKIDCLRFFSASTADAIKSLINKTKFKM